ncbi:hypothetical protein ACIBAH_26080 [Streptomyces sp. NPDC051445]|uniref:hypothetical protein n=1 Tax=unclassified Streptomyces TaxID=2593676 RepID=UPI00379BC55E
MSIRKSSHMSAKSRAIAAVAAASIGGSVLIVGTAPPAAAVDLVTVTYKGTVSCETRYPNDNSRPIKVTLSNGPTAAPRTATDTIENEGKRTADFGPTDLVVPEDAKFQLAVAVTCKAPSSKAKKPFNVKFEQNNLQDEDDVVLTIK